MRSNQFRDHKVTIAVEAGAKSIRRAYALSRITAKSQPYVFMLPAILLVAGVSFYPVGYAVYLSLFQTKYLKLISFLGIGNYVHFWQDPAAWQSLFHSAVYVYGSLAIVLPFSLGVALLLNMHIPFQWFFRTLIILPWAISQTILALLWGWLLNPDFGPVSYFLDSLGIGKLPLLSNPRLALPTLIGVNAWGSYPVATILFLAALQTIPSELADASKVDGTSRLQHFLFITLPLIRPTALVIIVLLSLLYFNMVTLIFVLTGGGPLASTEVLSLRVFNEAFQYWRVGYSAALGVILFCFNILFSLLYIRVIKQEPFY